MSVIKTDGLVVMLEPAVPGPQLHFPYAVLRNFYTRALLHGAQSLILVRLRVLKPPLGVEVKPAHYRSCPIRLHSGGHVLNFVGPPDLLNLLTQGLYSRSSFLKMMLSYDYTQTLLLLVTYMLIYNVTSFLLFSSLLQVMNTSMKTLYAFASLGPSNFFTKAINIALLSLAGVPPLLGFFSKIFIFVLLSNSNLFVLFPPFFILLFIGLYFYIQNLRFLNSTGASTLEQPTELTLRFNFLYFTYALPIIFIVIFGFCYVEDFMLVVS